MKEKEIRTRIKIYSAGLTFLLVGSFLLTYMVAQGEETQTAPPTLTSSELMSNPATTRNYYVPYQNTVPVVTTANIPDGIIIPDRSRITEVVSNEGIPLYISAFPNPVSDFVVLKVDNFGDIPLYYQLYNTQGELMLNKRVVSNETDIEMNDFARGMYFLRVRENSNELKTFKIVKR